MHLRPAPPASRRTGYVARVTQVRRVRGGLRRWWPDASAAGGLARARLLRARARSSARAGSSRVRAASGASSASSPTRHYGSIRVRPREKPELQRQEGRRHRLGPAGLTAAWHLARRGYDVKIFESAPSPAACCASPCRPTGSRRRRHGYRQRDRPGVDIGPTRGVDDVAASRSGLRLRPRRDRHALVDPACASPARSSRASAGARVPQRRQARRAPRRWRARGCWSIGGGNVAIDAARTALRLGARGRRPGQPRVLRRDAGPRLRGR